MRRGVIVPGIDRRRNQHLWLLIRFLRKYSLFLISLVLLSISVFFYFEVETHPVSAEPDSQTNGGSE